MFMILVREVSVPVGWRSGSQMALTLVATISGGLFRSPKPLFFLLSVYFFHRWSSRVIKLDECTQKHSSRHLYLSRPRWPFWDPLVAILDFADCVALQAPLSWFSNFDQEYAS